MPGGLKPRHSPRYPIVLSLAYRSVSKGATAMLEGCGQTRNLSETGGCVELADSLAPGARLTVVLHDDTERLTLEAEVVWAGHPPLPSGGTVHGVRFPQSAPEKRQALENLIRRRGGLASQATRIPLALPAECRALGTANDAVHGWTGDLGSKGCLLLLPDRFPVGTLIEVALTTSRGDLTAKATVMWVDPTERVVTRQLVRHGVKFAEGSWACDRILELISDRSPARVWEEPLTE
jgi:hypothetical protein